MADARRSLFVDGHHAAAGGGASAAAADDDGPFVVGGQRSGGQYAGYESVVAALVSNLPVDKSHRVSLVYEDDPEGEAVLTAMKDYQRSVGNRVYTSGAFEPGAFDPAAAADATGSSAPRAIASHSSTCPRSDASVAAATPARHAATAFFGFRSAASARPLVTCAAT